MGIGKPCPVPASGGAVKTSTAFSAKAQRILKDTHQYADA